MPVFASKAHIGILSGKTCFGKPRFPLI